MPEDNETRQIIITQATNSAGNAYGPVTGNALAYFAIWWVGHKHGLTFNDEMLAIAMGGALATTLILELRRVFSAIGRFIDLFLTRKAS